MGKRIATSGDVEAIIVKLWAENWSTAAIGQKLGMKAHTVAGKIGRMRLLGYNLPKRNNTPLPSPTVTAAPVPDAEPSLPPVPPPELPALIVPPVGSPPPSKGCKFILRLRGEGGAREALFCDQPRNNHHAYCDEHRERCYIPRKLAAPPPDPTRIPAPGFGSLGWAA